MLYLSGKKLKLRQIWKRVTTFLEFLREIWKVPKVIFGQVKKYLCKLLFDPLPKKLLTAFISYGLVQKYKQYFTDVAPAVNTSEIFIRLIDNSSVFYLFGIKANCKL